MLLASLKKMYIDPTGDPTCHEQTSEHGGPVLASDVRSPAAALHAADSSPAAAPASRTSAESGRHPAGRVVSVYVLCVCVRIKNGK